MNKKDLEMREEARAAIIEALKADTPGIIATYTTKYSTPTTTL